MLVTLADDIAQIIGDYRRDDGIQITAVSILDWVSQFDSEDRLFLLEELKRIFNERYISKSDATNCLKAIIKRLAEDLDYSDISRFLGETVFLDLQEKGKSQTDIRDLMNEVIETEYKFTATECGTEHQRNFIYLDDLPCTGNTVYNHMTRWLSENNKDGVSNLISAQKKQSNVIFSYLILHGLNYNKLSWRFKFSNQDFPYKSYRFLEVDNDYRNHTSKLDFVLPIEEGQPQEVVDYFNSLGAAGKSGIFRNIRRPTEETFFSSAENRIRFENILLRKGLEILSTVANKKENLRPLGYTLPSHKNFGFGTLCFTWRNIANNVPLVFWYSSANWKPLFEKKSYDSWADLTILFGRGRKDTDEVS